MISQKAGLPKAGSPVLYAHWKMLLILFVVERPLLILLLLHILFPFGLLLASLAWRIIRRGYSEYIDLPWMEFQMDGQTTKRCFPALAGAGMDARACELVRWETKKTSGQFAYLLAGLQTLQESLPPFMVKTPEKTVGRAELIMFGNGHMYGGPFDIFPQASLTDGKVDAIVVEKVEGWRLAEYTQAVLVGRLPALSGVHYLQSDAYELCPLEDRRVPVQLDGDTMGQLPGKVSVQRQAMQMVMAEPE